MHSYHFKRDAAFLSILAIGVAYVALVGTVFLKVINGCLMQLILLGESIAGGAGSIFQLMRSPEFLFHTIIGSLSCVLLLWMLRAIIVTFIQLVRTRTYIRSLVIIGDYNSFAKIFHSDQVRIFTAGLLSPTIYISSKAIRTLTPKQIKTIRLHEQAHVKNRDPLKGILAHLVNRIMPLFPMKRAFFSSYKLLTELSCDEYCEAILQSKVPIVDSLLAMFNANDSLQYSGVHNFFSAKSRISILVGKTRFQSKRLALQVAIFFGVILSGLVWTTTTRAFSSCNHLGECFRSAFIATEENDSSNAPSCEEHSQLHFESRAFSTASSQNNSHKK